MTFEIALLLVVIVIALFLFATEWLSPDVTALLLLLVLVLSGLLPYDRAFNGFGSDTFTLFLGLFIMSGALRETGVVELLGRRILAFSGSNPEHLLLAIMVSVCVLSAFMSNTAATAFFLPAVLGLARKVKIPASRLLMPLAFASILSSSVSVISSSTNIVINGVLTQYKLPPFSMFELAPVGLPIAIVGLVYMWFLGRRMIPDRGASDSQGGLENFHAYLSEIVIEPASSLIGKTLSESPLQRDLGLTVVRIIKGATTLTMPVPWTMLEAGDVLLVEANREDLLKVKDEFGIELRGDVSSKKDNMDVENLSIAEGVVLPGSPLVGQTLVSARFRHLYNCQVLGLNRRNERKWTKLGEIALKIGDILLIQGDAEYLKGLDRSGAVRLLSVHEPERIAMQKAPMALAVFIGALALGTFKVVPLAIATLIGALFMFLTHCISTHTAYRRLEWRALILVACMLGLGEAMQATGTERYVASYLVGHIGGSSEWVVLSAFFILAVALTQPLSNQAAAILLVPVAIQTAHQLGVDPRPLAATIAIAASCSYLTPLEPSCLMVYGPGNYRFTDFLLVGFPLTLLTYVVTILLVPLVW